MANKTNCVINGKEYYRIRKKIGEDSRGKSIIKPFYGKNKKDAERMVAEWEVSRRSGTVSGKEYLSQVIEYYIENVMMKSDLAEGSKTRYKITYTKHIKDTKMTLMPISEINSKIIQEFYNELTESGKRIEMIHKVLSGFFKYADSIGYCRNPLVNVTVKRNRKADEQIVVFTHDEVSKILNSQYDSPNSQYRSAILFALGTGVRAGELVALTWDDIKGNDVHITKQAIYDINSKLKIDTVKTENSVRSIPIPSFVMEALPKRSGDLIFCTSNGTMLDKKNLSITYFRFLKSIGVKRKSFHALRRTYCTMLCESGVPIQIASKLMGHSSISVTAKYYTFVSDKEKIDASQKLDDVLRGLKKG